MAPSNPSRPFERDRTWRYSGWKRRGIRSKSTRFPRPLVGLQCAAGGAAAGGADDGSVALDGRVVVGVVALAAPLC